VRVQGGSGNTRRRSDDFAVRRWLVAGAASAGMSAALWGMTLAGPQIGVAAAEDTASSSSVSAGAPSQAGGAADSNDTSAGVESKASKTESSSEAASETDADTATKTETDTKTDTQTESDTQAKLDTETESEPDTKLESDDVSPTHSVTHLQTSDDKLADTAEPADTTATATTTATTTVSTAAKVDTVAASAETAETAETKETADSTAPASATVETASPQSVVVSVDAPNDQRQIVANLISGLFGVGNGLISALPLPDPLKSWMYDSWFGVRRTLFNQAPWANPVQVSGQSGGPITGNLGAVDLEGDTITYRVTQLPTAGSVVVNADGSYTYTPGSSFTGVDNFVIAVSDSGPHFNLLDPFRGASTTVSLLVNKSAVKFVFNFTTGANYWSQDARNALQTAADTVAAYFIVTKPVVVTYDIVGENDPSSGDLARALSTLISSNPGIYPTIVQNKLQTGVDSNGTAADGQISWNFAYPWAFGDLVGAGSYDFTAVAMHELLHSFGFTSYVSSPDLIGSRAWTTYDGLLMSADGTHLITDDYRLNSAIKADLTGANGGLYLGGDGAVAAYGALVKVYTPSPFAAGTSISHLDKGTFGSNHLIMTPSFTTGRSSRTLSDIELGIMKDLGYTLASPTPSSAVALFGFVFLIRRRKAESSDQN